MPRSPVTIEAIGVRWQLDVSSLPQEHGDVLVALWSRARVEEDPSAPRFVVVPAGGDLGEEAGVAGVRDVADLPYVVSRALTLASISRQRGRLVLLHAAGLGSSDGQRCVVLVAQSGGGKSTAMRTLGTTFGYVSDETIGIADDHSVLPYPKPLSVLESDRSGKAEYSPDELGLQPTPRRARLAAVISLQRSAQPTAPSLIQEHLITGVLHLIAQSSSTPMLDRPLQRLAEIAVTGGGPYALRYHEIGDCTSIIAASLTAREEPPPWTAHPPPADRFLPGMVPEDGSLAPQPADEEGTDTGEPDPEIVLDGQTLVWRGKWTDAIESEKEVLVLIDRDPLRLAGIGATAWLAAGQPMTIGELSDRIISAHGPHPDSERLISSSILDMVRASALEVVSVPV
ncbi:MAG: hypothetical protein ABI131_09440 [Nostocoides sp.]